jgi:hypothetical protein
MTFLRRSLVLVLPLLLLLAQHGALAHALSHLDPYSAPVQEKSLVHLKLCGKCVSAEKLGHFTGAGIQPVVVDAARYLICSRSERSFAARALSPYFSRGPPVSSES